MDNKMNEMFEHVVMDEDRKKQIWEELKKEKLKTHHFSLQKGIAVAACLLALLIPVGAMAASGFQWPFMKEFGEEENKQLNPLFKNEKNELTAYGLKFRVEKALCDNSMNIGYFYVSVEDVSGKGIHPTGGARIEENAEHKKGDILFDFKENVRGAIYDKKNSTDTKYYFYVENELSPNDTDQIQNLTIEFTKYEHNDSHGQHSELLREERLKADHITSMPVLTWKMGDVQVKVSSIAAQVADKNPGELQIVLKNNKKIKDYFDYNTDKIGKDGEVPDNSFTLKTSQEAKRSSDPTVIMYRFGYVDINQVEGIIYDGKYYNLEDAE